MDISLSDLRITIRRGQSINLYAKTPRGKPRWNFTKEQIDASVESGSIFKKGKVIKIRKVAPLMFSNRIDIKEDAVSRDASRLKRKATEIVVEEFPDLDFEDGTDAVSQERFAAENAEMDFLDRAPAIPVDPKFKKLSQDDE